MHSLLPSSWKTRFVGEKPKTQHSQVACPKESGDLTPTLTPKLGPPDSSLDHLPSQVHHGRLLRPSWERCPLDGLTSLTKMGFCSSSFFHGGFKSIRLGEEVDGERRRETEKGEVIVTIFGALWASLDSGSPPPRCDVTSQPPQMTPRDSLSAFCFLTARAQSGAYWVEGRTAAP